MRLGIVPYLNCFPLIYGLRAEIYREVPSKLVQKSSGNDILLAPIVEAFLKPDWYLIDGVGIGSLGPAETVKLFFKENTVTIQKINKIFIDHESKTSVSLLKILLKNFYHRSLDSITFSKELRVADSALLIGDKVWKATDSSCMDLGEAWYQFTKLPFVFACWMTRSKETALQWKETLVSQAKNNLENLESLLPKVPKNDCPNILKYWKNLKYNLDDPSKNGIALFQKYWSELEAKPMLKLQWI